MTGNHLQRQRVWRPNLLLRGLVGGIGLLWVAVLAGSPYLWVHPCFGAGRQCNPADRAPLGEFAVFVVVIALIATAFVSFFWVSLTLQDGTLRLRKLIWRRRVIPLADVVSVEPGYYGLQIRMHDGRTEVSGAVQKSNLAERMNRVTRADRTASQLTALAQDAWIAHH